MPITLTPKQQEARALSNSPARFILFRGGSRSGKSFAICYFVLMRALFTPKSRHGIFRHTAVDVRSSLFDLTFKSVMDIAYPGLWDQLKQDRKINDSEMTIELPNGSIIMFNGLDDSTRQDRILGHEYSTIFVNEVSQFKSFDIIRKLMSRLSLELPISTSGKMLKPKLFLDCNPTTKRHWTFKAFIEGINPISGEVWSKPEHWAEIHMNPVDNAANIAADYVEDVLGNFSARDRRRFIDGEWQADNDNALFNFEWIASNRLAARSPFDVDDLVRIIVAVDPAISSHEGSDETGIIVAGIDADGHVHILEDCSMKGQPQQWAEKAIDAYHRWQADSIVAEKNQGGEMVSNTLRMVSGSVPVKLVHASRGKVVRAEPVSALYEQGKVHHCGTFEKLEGQLEDFTIDFNRRQGSPDRLDALVWAVSELAVKEVEKRGGSQQMVAGFWR